MMMKKRTLALACALSLALLAACGSKEQPAPQVPETPEIEVPAAPEVETPETPDAPEADVPETDIPEDDVPALELSHADVTLKGEGSTFELRANLDGKLYFGSEDESIAAVDENGTVIAVAPGKTTILVESEDGQTAACIVRCDWEVAAEPPETEVPDEPVSSKVDLMTFYTQTMESIPEDNRPFMMVLEADMTDMIEGMYPGLGAVNTAQRVLAVPAISAVAFEMAMVECADAADVETVKAIFQTRIDNQINGGAWYPETIDGWTNFSKIVVKGNIVALFVADPAMVDMAGEFDKLF